MTFPFSRNRSRFTALVSIAAISFSLISASTSYAAIRLGDACPREKATAKVGSVGLLCVRVDKTLVWSNASSEPSYAYGPRGRLQYRYTNGIQERLASNKSWASSDKRDSAYFHRIRVAAYKSIRALENDPTHSNVNFEFLIQPNFPTQISEVIKAQSASTAAYLSPLLQKKLDVKLILITEKDREFINNDLGKIVPSYYWQGALQILDYYDSLESFYSRSGTGGGTASYLADQGFAYYIGHTSSFATMDTYWPEVAPHEMAHVIQGVLSGGEKQEGQRFPEGHSQAKWHGHLIEGSANTLGMAFGFDHLGWYSDEMDHLLSSEIARLGGDVKMRTVSDAVKLIQRIESRGDKVSNSLSYSAGQILWEYFIGKYGAQKLIELYKNVPTSESFSTNIKETVGISKEKFYKDAAPYLLATWNRLS